MSRAYVPVALRERVAVAAHHRCGYCLTATRVVGVPMEIDHLLPEALGGATVEGNLWLACPTCNGHKASRVAATDPATGEVVRFFNPRRDAWADHFTWADGGTRIVGLTPVGRATAVALDMNNPFIVASRQIWVAAGWHPPTD